MSVKTSGIKSTPTLHLIEAMSELFSLGKNKGDNKPRECFHGAIHLLHTSIVCRV
jgi:hypothetical protein